jgi:hypothetical protein
MVVRLGAGVLAAAAVLGLGLTGCSSMERASTTPPTTTYAGPPIGAVAPPSAAPGASAAPAVPGAAAPGASVAPGASAAPGAPVAKVSATSASEEEIFRARSRAGVPTPDRWTAEVIESRPYPANDPNLGKLRQNLAKSNPAPAPGIVDKIVFALTP